MKQTIIHKLSNIILLLILAMGVNGTWAQTASMWDGTAATAFASGSGTQADPYVISSAAELAYFGSQMNDKTYYVKLTADIDLNNREWTYGKNSATNFKGHFDGNGKTISNLSIVPTTKKYNGFFSSLQGSATSRAEVKDLIIDGVTISQTADLEGTTITGALAGNVTEYTDIDSVTVKNVSVSFGNLTGSNYLGAFVGRFEKNNSTLKNCSVESPSISITGEIKTGASYIGGAIGQFAGSANLLSKIDGLTVKSPSVTINKVSIKDSYIGAVFGRVNTYVALDDITVSNPTLTYNYDGTLNVALNIGSFAGGIFGAGDQQTAVKNVTVSGTALLTIGTEANKTSTNIANVKAGLIGQSTTNVLLEDWTIENTKVDILGNLATTASNIGGFVGYTLPQDANNAQFTINKVKITGKSSISVSGNISVASYLGGLVGYMQGRSKTGSSNTLSNDAIATTEITVEGKCSIKDSRIGGLVGYVNTGSNISDCEISTATNLAFNDVGGAIYIGGAIGDLVGSNGYPSTVKTLTVKSPTISVNNYSAGASNTGGVFGRVSTYTDVDGVSVKGTSTISATVSVAQNIGSVIGNITGNATEQIVAKNITLENSAITFNANSAGNIVGPKAGLIGYASTNVLLDTWTVTGTNDITVNGNLATTGSQLGGFVGGIASANGGPVEIKKIVFEKANNVTLTGNVGVASYIGGFVGNATGNGNPESGITISDITLKEPIVTIGGQVTTASHFGGMISYATTACDFSDLKTTAGTKLTFNGNITNTANVGGILGSLIGTAAYPSTLSSINSEKVTLTINGDVSGTLNLGGLVGNLNIASLSASTVSSADIVLNCNHTGSMYVGGAVGYMTQTVSPFATIEKVTVKNSKIHTSGTHTYARSNKTLAVGGLVGYMAQEATKFTDVHNCVVESINIDLSGYIPQAGNTSGSLYNQQQNAFVVGGVIGRINTPSRLPEYLYFSGKINAPFAVVAPIVGVFLTSIGAAAYAYDDYTGANAPNVANQWQKALTWYYTDYNLGLSSAVRTQTARTKNYTASTTPVGGVEYLNITSSTLKEYNAMGNISKTVLRYDISGTNRDFGIFPAWNTNSATYPAYYMYYMQGVNRGKYVETSMAEATKSIVLNGMLYTLNFSQSTGRSFAKTFTVSSTEPMDSYEWYINGEKKSETSNQYSTVMTIEQVADPNTNIYIYGIKGGKKVAMATGVPSRVVLRVKDESKAATTYGTKSNPYLIGGTYGAQELQLLSYLSTLDNNIKWEESFISSTHYNRAYYELESDIDMSGIADFTPISLPKSNNTDGTSSGYHQNFVFDGVFDGKGYTISGLKIGWYAGALNTNDQNMGWGLFAAVGNTTAQKKVGDATASNAVIKNLIIDDATLTHRTDNTSFYYNNGTSGNANNCMVGVLAGIVTSNTTIQNIEIRNSKITDDGSRNYSLAGKGLYVGGAIGSVQAGYNATGNAPANTQIQHVAANVDFTLIKPQFADASAVAQLGQFNIGGIIGRYIATSVKQDAVESMIMPAYTIYSGTVNAPKAWISPVLASLRYSNQQATNDWKNYSKQWEGNNNSEDTQIHIANALYYDFYIGSTKITESVPSNTCTRGFRTMSGHADAAESALSYSAQKYQGVNYEARYIDSEGASLALLNENAFEDYHWVWEDGFVHMSTDPYVEAVLTRVDNTFTAGLVGGTPVSYKWDVSFDGETWIEVPSASTEDYIAYPSLKPKYIVALVNDGTKDYRTVVELVEANPRLIHPTITNEGNVYSFELNSTAPDGQMTTTYEWYETKDAPFSPSVIDTDLTLTDAQIAANDGVVWCKVIVTELGVTMYEDLLIAGATVVYVNGDNYNKNGALPGNDENDGMTPQTPVLTIDKANSLLKSKAEGGTWDKNIIVVMGLLDPDYKFQSTGSNPATLTGKWNGIDYEGVIRLDLHDPLKPGSTTATSEHAVNPVHQPGKKGSNCYVLHDTKFEYLTFYGNTGGNNFIECHGNDVTFGKGLVMTNFKNLSQSHGNFGESERIPEFTIILTATNLCAEDIALYTQNRTKPQVLTIQSGHYGRVMGGRFTQGFFAEAENTAHSILASAENPLWAVINVEIDDENPKTDGDGKTGSTTYTCDINGLIAGLTDGSIWGDYEINVRGGSIVYVVGGNQGNPIKNGTATCTPVDGTEGSWGQWPNATFFGRTVINIDQDPALNNNINIGNLYAGSLGRQLQADAGGNQSIVDMYIYGHTEVNMIRGTITGSLYGGGAGGVVGTNPWDLHAPYATTAANSASDGIQDKVQYGTFGSATKTVGDPLATVNLHKRKDDGTYEIEPLNLANSSTTLHVIGGTINGNVYGGGYGFVDNMPVEVTMQGVGSVFGTTNLNITGGTINGNVYGGSQGHTKYYGAKNQYGQTITHIAETNGTVNLNITGTEAVYPVISGTIYGAGQGIASVQKTATQADVDAGKAANVGDTFYEEYRRIATAGNTDLGDEYKTNINITVDMPEKVTFPNDIYGGGAMGLVDGTTNIVLKRGTFTGSIYGGGYGEKEHLDKALVTGTTNISTGAAKVDDVDKTSIVTLDGSIIYGGGDMAQVKGNTYVNINHGNVKADVYGGGRGLNQAESSGLSGYGRVTGNTRVWINNQTSGNVLTGNVYGGGALGAVQGNTNVVIKAGEVDGNVFGGGKGEEGSEKAKVTGNANVIVDKDWTEPTSKP